MQASDSMDLFKVGLTQMKEKLKQIQSKISDVDRNFYTKA